MILVNYIQHFEEIRSRLLLPRRVVALTSRLTTDSLSGLEKLRSSTEKSYSDLLFNLRYGYSFPKKRVEALYDFTASFVLSALKKIIKWGQPDVMRRYVELNGTQTILTTPMFNYSTSKSIVSVPLHRSITSSTTKISIYCSSKGSSPGGTFYFVFQPGFPTFPYSQAFDSFHSLQLNSKYAIHKFISDLGIRRYSWLLGLYYNDDRTRLT